MHLHPREDETRFIASPSPVDAHFRSSRFESRADAGPQPEGSAPRVSTPSGLPSCEVRAMHKVGSAPLCPVSRGPLASWLRSAWSRGREAASQPPRLGCLDPRAGPQDRADYGCPSGQPGAAGGGKEGLGC